MSITGVVALSSPSLPLPYEIHLAITSRCNLSCVNCYYPRGNDEWTQSEAEKLVREMARLGITWLAIGGGEPLLWEGLGDLIEIARSLGIRVAVTTNGTILSPIRPQAIHVSYDIMHREQAGDAALEALRYYAGLGIIERGLNVIADPIFARQLLQRLPDYAEMVLLILPKPIPRQYDTGWINSLQQPNVYVDSCLFQLLNEQQGEVCPPCLQGRVSMAIDAKKEVSICSNVPPAARLVNLAIKEAWDKIRLQTMTAPSSCLLEKYKEEKCLTRD